MKILQVNCVYNTGSTGKIMHDIHTELINKGVESVICYGRGAKTQDVGVYKTCGELYSKFNNLLSRFTGIMYGGCFFSTNKLISIIKKEKPDIVHLHCINGYFVNIYRLITWLKKNKIKTVITLHAEFMYTANCSYSFDCNRWKNGCGNCPVFKKETKSYFWDNTAISFKKMQKAFEGFGENLIAVSCSTWQLARAKQSPIFADKKHTIVFNGLDTEIFHVYDNLKDIKAKYGLADKPVIFHATPFFTDDKMYIKGGYYVLELAKMLEEENIRIVVAGPYKTDMQLPKNILLLGKIVNQSELAKLYSMADVTLLTSKKETFSMVTAESLCCGTPVVGFKAGGPETIALSEYGVFTDFGNTKALKELLFETLNKDNNPLKLSGIAALKYDKSVMFEKYFQIYNKMFEK